ncbi:MAG: hypothetical protein V2A70_00540 [Candidatus Omnitrophota bacterium]
MVRKYVKNIVSILVLFAFLVNTSGSAYAQLAMPLPEPGSMVSLSEAYQPVLIKGMSIHKDNPFIFDFIVDSGQDRLQGEALKAEGERLIKYFMAGMTIPGKDLWVNLSPYEKNRVTSQHLGETDLGKDLLAQDYILKQLTASLIYPKKELGKTFWDKVYSRTQDLYGISEVPVDTFNKVWIMIDEAEVFEQGQTVFVTKCHLHVLMEQDYLALQKSRGQEVGSLDPRPEGHALTSEIMKEAVLPLLEKEVNTGKSFSSLRQVFHSLILAGWYKNNIKESILSES